MPNLGSASEWSLLPVTGQSNNYVLNNRVTVNAFSASLTASSVLSTAVGERCDVCGAFYSCRDSLLAHQKKHRGLTRCPVCGIELAAMNSLRRHMMTQHGLSKCAVNRMTNTRLSGV